MKDSCILSYDGWKTGTVALEPCGTFGDFPTPPETVVDDAIVWLPEIERLVMKLGFRLVLRKVDYTRESRPGSDLIIFMKWENLGIAPPYRDQNRTCYTHCKLWKDRWYILGSIKIIR